MLEAVVEHDRLEGVLLAGERGGLGASVPADDDAWKAAGGEHPPRAAGGGRDERSAEGARTGRRRFPGAPGHRLERARHHAESGSASAKAAEVRRAAITFTCRSIAPRPLSTSTRARRPMSIARRGSLRSPASAQARLSVELTRSAPPPAMSRSTTSRVFAVWGPTSTGHPARAGSITLCPPAATRLPPTKAATARGEQWASGPTT